MVTQQQLPQTGFFRLAQIIGAKGNSALIPVSRTTWLNGVKSGKYPKPIKLGARAIGWRVADIYALIDEMGEA